MRCRVCGREGFEICPECQFKELNQQCWRCGMYLPIAEMQQWRGQWVCPNCRMDLEREESEAAGERKGKPGDEAAAELNEKKGRCDRCGRETLMLYKFNGRNLCWYCLEKEDTHAGAGGAGGAIPLQLTRERKKKKGILKRIREFFLGKGPEEEETEVEISVASVVPIKKRGKESDIVPVRKGAEAEVVPKKGEEPKKEEITGHMEEKRGKGPVIEKEKGEPSNEKKGEKKKPEWGEWKKD